MRQKLAFIGVELAIIHAQSGEHDRAIASHGLPRIGLHTTGSEARDPRPESPWTVKLW